MNIPLLLQRTALLCACLWAAPLLAAGTEPPLPGDSVYQLDVPLTDQNGVTQRFPALRGKVRIISMFYANCPYVCPMIINTIKQTENALTEAQRAQTGVLLISLDPERDTPEELKKVETTRHLDGSRWMLVRTPAGDVRKLAALLGIQYRALENRDFNHSTAIILLDADGRIRATSDHIGEPDPEFESALKALLPSH